MEDPLNFHTQKGYEMTDSKELTIAMEDYLEMIRRLSLSSGSTRIHLLAQSLNVKPSSASKMVDNLRHMGLVGAGKYGEVRLTPQGETLGDYLLYRHQLLNRILCFVNQSQDELEQAERIEHFLDERTVYNLARLFEGKA